jgi:hypothetical protein
LKERRAESRAGANFFEDIDSKGDVGMDCARSREQEAFLSERKKQAIHG